MADVAKSAIVAVSPSPTADALADASRTLPASLALMPAEVM